DKGKDTRDYLAAAFPELNAWERAGADASSAGMVDAGRSEERFSRNAETDLVCRLLLEKKNKYQIWYSCFSLIIIICIFYLYYEYIYAHQYIEQVFRSHV